MRKTKAQLLKGKAKAASTPNNPDQVRLLGKHEVCALVGKSFPTVWAWMGAGTFPRSRIVGGCSMWRSDEINEWLDGLPVRPVKGAAS